MEETKKMESEQEKTKIQEQEKTPTILLKRQNSSVLIIPSDKKDISVFFEFILSLVFGVSIIILYFIYPENQVVSGALAAIIPSILALWIKNPRDAKQINTFIKAFLKSQDETSKSLTVSSSSSTNNGDKKGELQSKSSNFISLISSSLVKEEDTSS